MVEFLTISWIIGIIGIIIGIIDTNLFFKGIHILKASYETKKTLIFLGVTIICVYSLLLTIIILGFLKVETTNKLWIIFPLLCIPAGICWTIGTYKLLDLVKEAPEENE